MSRVAHWLWQGRGLGARVARTGLSPASRGIEAIAALRASAYQCGMLRARALPLPSVSVGNLSVGGTGKTPIASWIAGYFTRQGIRPGILLRGYGADEGDVHRQALPAAVVVEDANRIRGAHRAMSGGARVLVLDDAFQRLDVRKGLDFVLVATESAGQARRTLPAGPWREGWSALARASHVIVTRKRAPSARAAEVAERLLGMVRSGCPIAIAELHLASFQGMVSGRMAALSAIEGRRVLAVAGIADPASFGAQLERLNARVRLQDWPDHHRFGVRDVQQIRRASGRADVIVLTMKDAVKLRAIWPADLPEPLIANLGVRWEQGGDQVVRALHELTIHHGGSR